MAHHADSAENLDVGMIYHLLKHPYLVSSKSMHWRLFIGLLLRDLYDVLNRRLPTGYFLFPLKNLPKMPCLDKASWT
jgi:hypothetical protein